MIDTEKLPDVPGVYLLTNTVTGDTYIGSSTTSIRGRVKIHLSAWRSEGAFQTSRSLYLLAHEHGAQSFTASAIRTCKSSFARIYERQAMMRLQPTLNRMPGHRVTVDLPPNLKTKLCRHAAVLGISVETAATRLLAMGLSSKPKRP